MIVSKFKDFNFTDSKLPVKTTKFMSYEILHTQYWPTMVICLAITNQITPYTHKY